MLVVWYFLFVAGCSVRVAGCLVFVVCRVLFDVCGLLCCVWCLRVCACFVYYLYIICLLSVVRC